MGKSTWTDDEPRCPECGFSDQDWWDGLKGGEIRITWQCDCGAELVSEIEYTVHFQTALKEDPDA